MAGKLNDGVEPLSDINITPFVDILLVLLVIFMLTAPVITHTLKVQLPEEKLSPTTITDNQKFVVSMSKSGKLWVHGKRVNLKNALAQTSQFHQKYPNQSVFIRADKRVIYGKIVHLMSNIRNLGITNIGLLVLKKANVFRSE